MGTDLAAERRFALHLLRGSFSPITAKSEGYRTAGPSTS